MSDQMRIPVRVGDRVEYVRVDASSSGQEQERIEAERRRVDGIARRRQYMSGTQFDQVNRDAEASYCVGERKGMPLPEHRRLHAYSTQIEDCVRFVSARISSGLAVEPRAEIVADVIDEMVMHSPQLWTYNEEGEKVFTVQDALRDALVAGDIAVHVGWDPVEGAVYAELWESELVEVQQETMVGPDRVILSQMRWRDVPGSSPRVEKYLMTWEYEETEHGRDVAVEARWEQDEKPESRRLLGLGRIPWTLLRGATEGIRDVRGASLVSEQAMETADRYNAVEQVGYLIARYNSHANIAVVGDAAMLKVESEGRVNRDVADVLTFPGGTNLQVLTLPTDPQMIDHQREVLAEALYNKFGVTRLEARSLTGLGQMSGYALEILNQKSDATFTTIARQWRRDLSVLFDLVLDVYAWKQAGFDAGDGDDSDDVFGPVAEPVVEEVATVPAWVSVDPAAVFPDRRVRIVLGTGFVQDDVKIRDDFKYGLISRREALRKRGYTDTQIQVIIDEIDEEKSAAAARFVGASTGEGSSGLFGGDLTQDRE